MPSRIFYQFSHVIKNKSLLDFFTYEALNIIFQLVHEYVIILKQGSVYYLITIETDPPPYVQQNLIVILTIKKLLVFKYFFQLFHILLFHEISIFHKHLQIIIIIKTLPPGVTTVREIIKEQNIIQKKIYMWHTYIYIYI